jgi:hypothetical protein
MDEHKMGVPKRRSLDDRAKENSVALHSSSQDVMIFADQDSPLPEPVPALGMTYIRASELGCALECDLKIGRHKPLAELLPTTGRLSMRRWPANAHHLITVVIEGSALTSTAVPPRQRLDWIIVGQACGKEFAAKGGRKTRMGPRGRSEKFRGPDRIQSSRQVPVRSPGKGGAT